MKSDLLAPLQPQSDSVVLSVSPEFATIEQLFDHVPETAFFLKDIRGRYTSVNQSLVERCGVAGKAQLLGHHVLEIFPKQLGQLYAEQDAYVIRTGQPIIDHLELHWYVRRRAGWCLTTKLPMRDRTGKVIGVAGVSRDLRAAGEAIPPSLPATLEYLEGHCDEHITASSLARHAGLPPVRFARLIKRIFRVTPKQLILQTRLTAAARLLTEKNQSIATIACACGFYDHSAMTRAFRSATNLTPTQFRELKRRSR